ncbi:DUF881 domain-containing protein [Cellulosimicrobium cellulans]|uniref:DUF881 domain-containing protein n=1 Tax=Cellulosimicrobium cellulans TaxID=1710 RepID=UPI002096FB73|nr:DUF881 domain-containing protein [Cellulosimicrobium cellulans]MCO7271762.1 DUF881 domain-containing protein [Cellulosimicrobium cellulans]
MSVTRDPQDPRDAATDDVTPDPAPDDAHETTDPTARRTTDDAATARPSPAGPDEGAVEADSEPERQPEGPEEPAVAHAGTGEAVDGAPDATGVEDDAPTDGSAREPDAAPGAADRDTDQDDAIGDGSSVDDDERGEPSAAATPVTGEEPEDDPTGTAPPENSDEGPETPDRAPLAAADAPADAPHPAPPHDDTTTGGGTTDSPASTDASTPGEPPATTGTIGAVGRHGAPTRPEPRGLRGLGRALRPRASRSQIVVGVLCALLGFALVVQVSQTQEDQLSSLRQSDLVRLLDDVTQRSGELEDQVSSLESTRDELQSGSGRERAALELAEQQAETLGILSGRLPAEGPGVEIEVVEGAEALDAFSLFNVLEELRNAGAEAMEVNGVRLVASSYFEDSAEGVVVDGQTISSPYRWNVIGDPSTLETALEIPGGAMASLRADGARTTITQQDRVEVAATVEPAAPQYATPVPADE